MSGTGSHRSDNMRAAASGIRGRRHHHDVDGALVMGAVSPAIAYGAALDDDRLDYRGELPRNSTQLDQWHGQVPAVAAIDPHLPIVDAHHHMFGAPGDPLLYPLEYLVQDLSQGHRVIGTVYIEAMHSGWRQIGPEAMRPVGEVEKIVRQTAAPLRASDGPCQVAAAIVSFADLALGDAVAEVLEAQIEAGQGRLRNVRYRTASDAGSVGRLMFECATPRLLCDATFRRGIAQLDRLGLGFEAWVYHHQLDEVIALADLFPDMPIVLNHAGGPIGVNEYRPHRQEVFAYWKLQLQALASRPNVVMKIGGMGMPVFGFGFDRGMRPADQHALANAWQPYVDACIEAFGTRRCLFESNFPVDMQSCSYVELWNAFKRCSRHLSEDERRDLFYRTACRTYRLPELEQLGDALCATQAQRTLGELHGATA